MLNTKKLAAGTAFAAVLVSGLLIGTRSGQAANDNNAAQDEKQMIQIGQSLVQTMLNQNPPIQIRVSGKDPDMLYLGSYLVNVHDCNGCHTADPSTEYLAPGNPYLLSPPFGGTKQYNPATFLGGGSDFGAFPSPNNMHIISRNLTPDKTGLPEGGHTLSQFIQILRTGVDMDHAHPNCPTNAPNCLFAPFDGSKLQVMPWPQFGNMTDRQLTAIYTFLSAVPCLEGGPGELPGRCGN